MEKLVYVNESFRRTRSERVICIEGGIPDKCEPRAAEARA